MTQRPMRSFLVLLVLVLTATAVAQEEPTTLADAIRQHPDLGTLTNLLDDSSIMDDLEDGMRLTVFAPSDTAFERLDPEVQRVLLRDRGALDVILRNHMVLGVTPMAALRRLDAVTTLEATRLNVRTDGEEVRVAGVRLAGAGIPADSGMVYVVDRVLVPRAATSLKALLTAPRGD